MTKLTNICRSLLICLTFAVSACVSVNIGPKSGERSKGVSFNVPGAPYQNLKESQADGAWQNRRNGNSISYFSTCNDPADPPLEFAARELFNELKDMSVVRNGQATFNGREALDQEVEGKVDGIITRVRALVFKKNGCLYTLSYIGVPRAFEADRNVFNEFLRGFQAP